MESGNTARRGTFIPNPKAVLKPPQSKRFARSLGIWWLREHLESAARLLPLGSKEPSYIRARRCRS